MRKENKITFQNTEDMFEQSIKDANASISQVDDKVKKL